MEDELDIDGYVKDFLPSLIRSLEGSIIRCIISKVYKSNGYILFHYNNCLYFNPNEYENVIKCIEKIYKSGLLTDLTDRYLFKNLENLIPSERKADLKKLIKVFKDYRFLRLEFNKDFSVSQVYPFCQ